MTDDTTNHTPGEGLQTSSTILYEGAQKFSGTLRALAWQAIGHNADCVGEYYYAESGDDLSGQVDRLRELGRFCKQVAADVDQRRHDANNARVRTLEVGCPNGSTVEVSGSRVDVESILETLHAGAASESRKILITERV